MHLHTKGTPRNLSLDLHMIFIDEYVLLCKTNYKLFPLFY